MATITEQPTSITLFNESIQILKLRMENKENLRKMYHASRNIRAIGFLWLLFGALLGIVALTADLGIEKLLVIFFVGLVFVTSGIGAFTRGTFAKFGFTAMCFLQLINIPIGTILGIIGLLAVGRYPAFFGNYRVSHKEIKIAYKASATGHNRMIPI
jgi:hypothetical protein